MEKTWCPGYFLAQVTVDMVAYSSATMVPVPISHTSVVVSQSWVHISYPTPPHPTSVVFTPDHALSET